MEYHYSVRNWLEAGRPLDEPFLIVRESAVLDAKSVNEDMLSLTLEGLCTLIIHRLAYYRDEAEGSGYHIEPVPSILCNARSYDYKGFTFTVYAAPSIYPGPSKVLLNVGAIATILSEKET